MTALKRLNVHKATGVDRVSARLLRMVAETIASSVAKLYNQSLASGEVRTEWKQANVTPSPSVQWQASHLTHPTISVLPVIAKVVESLIRKQLYTYLTKNSLLYPCQ